jgi:hypothetical protein
MTVNKVDFFADISPLNFVRRIDADPKRAMNQYSLRGAQIVAIASSARKQISVYYLLLDPHDGFVAPNLVDPHNGELVEASSVPMQVTADERDRPFFPDANQKWIDERKKQIAIHSRLINHAFAR